MGFRRALDAPYAIAHARRRHPSGGSNPVGPFEPGLPESNSVPPGERATP
ncbi:hypothetical protein ABIA39_007071 [Nocardia sp. GAS34]